MTRWRTAGCLISVLRCIVLYYFDKYKSNKKISRRSKEILNCIASVYYLFHKIMNLIDKMMKIVAITFSVLCYWNLKLNILWICIYLLYFFAVFCINNLRPNSKFIQKLWYTMLIFLYHNNYNYIRLIYSGLSNKKYQLLAGK